MTTTPVEEGLRIVTTESDPDGPVDDDVRDRPTGRADGALESLRDEFVEAFNARDIDAVLALVDREVECPDLSGSGPELLAEGLQGIWQRSPGALLTRAFLEGTPCAVAWIPDEDGCWSRAGLVCFDIENDLLTVVCLPDDTDALDRAEADDPTGEELEEWTDWAEWDRGEETVPQSRDRVRP